MLSIRCPECQTKNPQAAGKCLQCGTDLMAAWRTNAERLRLFIYLIFTAGFMTALGAFINVIWWSPDGLDAFLFYESVFFIGTVLTVVVLFLMLGLGGATKNPVRLGMYLGLVILIPTMALGAYLGTNHYRVLFTYSLIFALASLGIGQIMAHFRLKRPSLLNTDSGSLTREIEGALVVAEREFLSSLLSIRMVIIGAILALSMFAYAYFAASEPVYIDPPSPEEIMVDISTQMICTIGPLFAVALSFDAMTREKNTGSLTFLLSRPISKRSIALGKFMGVMGAIILPIIILTLAMVPLTASVMGEYPSMRMVLGVVVFTALLVAIYTLFQLIISTLAKTSGTAILAGVGLWIFFNIFWSIVILIAAIITGQDVTTEFGGILSVLYFVLGTDLGSRLSLFNPGGLSGGAYNMNVEQAAGFSPPGIHASLPFLCIVLWFLILFIAAIEIFNRKATN